MSHLDKPDQGHLAKGTPLVSKTLIYRTISENVDISRIDMASLPLCQRYLRYPFHCFAWVQNFTFNLYLVRETAEHEVDFLGPLRDKIHYSKRFLAQLDWHMTDNWL